ncbi:aspartate aminotransferase family protein [Ahniella affigens]|uniref:Aspartate aminotransferase family protein n=1 Tax=Ahniella affigens TaxID=2021234 RepID=A0A2P1PNS3_9GAMM|nr:aminotransferase class III-fold pyridoxal phosphate-dependent enzyme [Ahniella affigens]AVP96490.1 aspartate aminotransferase family protein [Ahniella affigens]
MSTEPARTEAIRLELLKVRERYAEHNPRSQLAHKEAIAYFPGGSTRSVLRNLPFPLTLAGGQGSKVWDIDGHEYFDCLGDYSAALLGHSNSQVAEIVSSTLAGGVSLGGRNTIETSLAKSLRSRFDSMELMRFTSSGTEANIIAIAATRAFANRSKVLVFSGAFHGALLNFSGESEALNVPFSFIRSIYNDVPQLERTITKHSRDLAAVIIEPMLNSAGCIVARTDFLEEVRRLTAQFEIPLIFDEVVTSRLYFGGLQRKMGIRPEITTLGKYLGGGLNFGAVGGRAEIMSRFDMDGPDALVHSGTFNNNVLTMAAAREVLNIYGEKEAVALNNHGDCLRETLNGIALKTDSSLSFTGVGSMMQAHMRKGTIERPYSMQLNELLLREIFYLFMLEMGVWIGRRGLITLSLPIITDRTGVLVDAVEAFISTYRSFLRG